MNALPVSSSPELISPLASKLVRFLAQKRAMGYRYREEGRALRELDRFLTTHLSTEDPVITLAIVHDYVARRGTESETTRAHRLTIMREVCRFLRLEDTRTVVPDRRFLRIVRQKFVPRVLSRDEGKRFLQACTELSNGRTSPVRDAVLGTALRLLYLAGLRAGELLRLRQADVDLDAGVLHIRHTKFDKSRMVPIAPDLAQHLVHCRKLATKHFAGGAPEKPFFPSPRGGRYSITALREAFHQTLKTAGIERTIGNRHIRLHDLRHSMAVLRLLLWCEQNADLGAKLPLLATYLGHVGLASSQRYLQLTRDLMGEITRRHQARFGYLINDGGLLMNLPTLPTLLSAFFLRYLAVERGVSPHTTTSYRDAMKLLLQFAAARCRRSVDQLGIEDLTASLVLEFLADLETSRGNTIRTRNSRLAALQTFFRYVAGREPALAATCSPVLSLPAKKTLRPLLGYLSEQELGHLLAQIDRLAKHGERDYVLLSILYDTGARIQELLDLTPRDFHLESPPFVCVRGKGRRERLCPLLPQSAQLVRQYLSAAGRQLNDPQPFLQNGRGGRLGRHGARYILLKYLRRATPAMPTLARVGISPHTMRHTKAMHLLQSGVPLVMVKDFLGHVDMKSTEVYVQGDLEMKRKALDSANGPQPTQAPTPLLSSSLIEWLEAL